MAQAWSVFVFVGLAIILAVMVSFTVQTSRGNAIPVKAAKFVGLFVSFMPIIAILMYVIFRGKPSGYGEKCGAMGLIGMGWYMVLQAGRRAFLS